jgi:aryl-alcohol dehydrogenase-like predicted oxidoreductase
MPVWQLAKAVYTARLTGRHAFASFQHHYNLLWREDESAAMPFCVAEGVGLLPYSPMARGYLPAGRDGLDRDSVRAGSDEYARLWYGRDEDRDVAAAVTDLAQERGLPPAVIALAWVLNRWPQSSPIVGATSVEHLDEAVGALGVELSADEIARLEAAYRPRLSHEHR